MEESSQNPIQLINPENPEISEGLTRTVFSTDRVIFAA